MLLTTNKNTSQYGTMNSNAWEYDGIPELVPDIKYISHKFIPIHNTKIWDDTNQNNDEY